MPSLIDEHATFPDASGAPLVGGKLYVGTQNQDPVSNPITIYSDRALSVSISNPQTLDAYGRTTQKVWIPGKYSLRVDDSAGVQQYQELDAGDPETTGITNLTNVLGTDTITADGSPTIASLTDNQQYNFRAANTNTGSVTLQIDLTAAKVIKKQHDVNLVAGDIEQNQTVSVIYNATDDVFELVSNVSNANFVDAIISNDLTVGNDFTYQSVIQPPIPAAVANHTRAGHHQLYRLTTAPTTFAWVAQIATGTWETVGPTGSGATNIWTAMDVMPSNATAVILSATYQADSGSASQTSVVGAAGPGDLTPPTSAFSWGFLYHTHDATAAGELLITSNWRFIVPLATDGSRTINVYSSYNNTQGAPQGTMYYMGFITDA